MSENSKPLPQASITDLHQTLEGVRDQATAAGSKEYASIATAYLSAFSTLLPLLSRWNPDALVVEQFAKAVGVAGHLYRQGDLGGVLRHSFTVLSALPGDPHSKPPRLPPLPGSDD
jgi:hypothetical protein